MQASRFSVATKIAGATEGLRAENLKSPGPSPGRRPEIRIRHATSANGSEMCLDVERHLSKLDPKSVLGHRILRPCRELDLVLRAAVVGHANAAGIDQHRLVNLADHLQVRVSAGHYPCRKAREGFAQRIVG